MNILLTGGAGYIGSHVALMLLDQKHQVTIIDSLVNGDLNLVPKNSKFLKSDIADEEKITNLLKKNKFDVVMHFAGFTRVGESVKFPDKYYENNNEKPKSFFNNCLKFGLKKIIFSSTGSVYGNSNQKTKIVETETPSPINPYSISKFKLEKYLLNISKNKEVDVIILRYFNVSGADENSRSGLLTNPDNLFKAICEVAVKKRDKFVVNGKNYKTKDGTTIRDFIHVSDLAEMHILAAETIINENITEIFNCGYGEGYSVKDVIDETNKILGENINVEFGPQREGDAVHTVANNKKFVEKFNWKPKYNNLNYIIKTALNWEKKLLNEL